MHYLMSTCTIRSIHSSSGGCFVYLQLSKDRQSERGVWKIIIFVHSYVSFLHPGSCDRCPSMQWMKGSKHPWDRTPIYLGADTRYHSSHYTFALSPPPPTLTYKTYHYWRLSRILFWYTCCICLRCIRESTGCFSYLSVQCRVPSWAARRVTSCEVTLHAESANEERPVLGYKTHSGT